MVSFKEKVNAVVKKQCEESFEFFVKYMFKAFNGFNFEVQPFHKRLFEEMDKLYKGEIKNLIINIPPRHSKTELTKMYIAWIMAKNPKAKSLILSYSADLATDNCSFVRDYTQAESFQTLWPMELKADKKGKGHWVNTSNGEVYAAAAGGQVTGFGAGVTGYPGASGGLVVIDDPLKVDDAESEKLRQGVNDRFVGTIRSRRNDTNVPMLLIMQRIHEDDLSGFLLDGGDGDDWTHLKIPAMDEDRKVIWPRVFSQNDAEIMERSQPYIFAGQYLQEPAPIGGGLLKEEWFEVVAPNEIPKGIKWEMFIDGAYTKDTKNDPTGIIIAGKSIEIVEEKSIKTLYIKFADSQYLELPELIRYVNAKMHSHDCAMALVEPKASGKSLVQMLRSMTNVSANEIKSKWAMKSKIDKAHDTAPYAEGGRIKIVGKASDDWIRQFLYQLAVFPAGKHDEYVDCLAYATERNLMRKQFRAF